MNKENVWSLFWNTFKSGDKIILITDDDKYDYGTLRSAGNDEICIKKESRTCHIYKWARIRFIAHDGFPVNKLIGADGSASIDDGDTELIVKYVKELEEEISIMEENLVSKKNRLSEIKYLQEEKIRNVLEEDLAKPTRSFVIGDPFEITNVSAKLFNRGKVWKENPIRWNDNQYEETIYLTHKSGVVGLLWDIQSIFYFK